MARPPSAASESRGNPAVARLVLRALRPRHAGQEKEDKDGRTSKPPPDHRAARRSPTRTARTTPPGDNRVAHKRRLAALASHPLTLPPLLATQHAADRV